MEAGINKEWDRWEFPLWLSRLRTQLVSRMMWVQSLALLSGLRKRHCCELWGRSCCRECGVGHRCGSDPILLWLWCRPAAAAPVRPPAWELPYATSTSLKSKKKKKKKKKKKRRGTVMGVPAVAQQVNHPLCLRGAQVQSPAQCAVG